MRYENTFCTIEYTECDLEYITKLIKELEDYYNKIMSFFNLEKLNNKVQIKLWDSLDDFKEYYKETMKEEAKDWTCGVSFNKHDLSRLDVLTLKERRKTKFHDTSTSKNIIKSVIHEFVHTCHMQFCNYIYPLKYISEGLATFLSNQYNEDGTVNCSLDDLLKNNVVNYKNYFLIMIYIINNYDHDYVLRLAKDKKFSFTELPKIYAEVNQADKNIKNFLSLETVDELYNYMKNNITYGYIGTSGKKYLYNDSDFYKDWRSQCVVQTGEKILKTKCGTCWDQVELERLWFEHHNYEFKTIYIIFEIEGPNEYPTHSLLAYKSNDKWYWFERAFEPEGETENGIKEFNTYEELLEAVVNKRLEYAIKINVAKPEDKDLIRCYEFDKLLNNVNIFDYQKHVTAPKIKTNC